MKKMILCLMMIASIGSVHALGDPISCQDKYLICTDGIWSRCDRIIEANPYLRNLQGSEREEVADKCFRESYGTYMCTYRLWLCENQPDWERPTPPDQRFNIYMRPGMP